MSVPVPLLPSTRSFETKRTTAPDAVIWNLSYKWFGLVCAGNEPAAAPRTSIGIGTSERIDMG
jgi:hypothetical protein